jgi:hypothetical protein
MNNPTINNNNGKNEIFIVRMTAHHCQRRFENVPLRVASFFIYIFQLFFSKKKERITPAVVAHSH